MDEEGTLELLRKVRDGTLEEVTADSLEELADDKLVHIIDSAGYGGFVELKGDYDRLRSEVDAAIKDLDRMYRKHHGGLHQSITRQKKLDAELISMDEARQNVYRLVDEYGEQLDKIEEYGYAVDIIEVKSKSLSVDKLKVLRDSVKWVSGQGFLGIFPGKLTLDYHKLKRGDYARLTETGVKKIQDADNKASAEAWAIAARHDNDHSVF